MTAVAAPPSANKTNASTSSSSPSSFLDRPVPGLTIGSAFVVWLGVTTVILPLVLKANLNLLAYCCLFFNNLNILIAICEIMLGRHIQFIKDDYQRLRKRYKKGVEYQAAFAYLTSPLSIHEALFVTTAGQQCWARMWSTYSLWDPSYQNDESFGFFIDVGNGWSTIPVNVAWNAAMLCPQQWQTPSPQTAAVWLGLIGAASYWQVLYGTIIYLLSFLWNRRYQNKPLLEVLGFVGFANGLWLVFPMFCLYASYQLVVTGDPVAVFWLSP